MAELEKILTLGDVLYARGESHLSTESEWVELVRSTAAGNEAALQALYARANRPVFTLMVRLTANRQTAEELTLDVFHDVWRRAAQYNPDDGTVLGWIMNQARSRAIDRLRFDFRKSATTRAHQPCPKARRPRIRRTSRYTNRRHASCAMPWPNLPRSNAARSNMPSFSG